MINICMVRVIYIVNFVLIGTNGTQPMWQQMETLKHVQAYLKEVQKDIKESRDLLRHIDNDYFLDYPTVAQLKVSTKNIIQMDLWKYFTPTASEGVLRSYSGNIMRDNDDDDATSDKAATDVQAATDKPVVPDLVPEYKDIFAADNDSLVLGNEMNTDNSTTIEEFPSITTAKGTSDIYAFDNSSVPAYDIHMLFSDMPADAMDGDILMGKVLTENATTEESHPVMHNQIQRDATGYFSVAVENLFMLVAIKEPEHVQEVLEPAFVIVETLQVPPSTHLHWMKYPMLDVLYQISGLVTKNALPIETIQAKAKLWWDIMKDRKTLLSSDVNEILDFADGLVKEEDGEKLFDRIDDFYNYPNETNRNFMEKQYTNGSELCEAILLAFEAPFFHETADRDRLVTDANDAIRRIFGHFFKGRRNRRPEHRVDVWLTTHYVSHTIGRKLNRPLRKPRTSMRMTYRGITRPRAVHKRKSKTPNPQAQTRSLSVKRLKQKYKNDFEKQSSYDTYRTTEKRFNRRFKSDDKKTLTIKPMLSTQPFLLDTKQFKDPEEWKKKRTRRTSKRYNGQFTSKRLKISATSHKQRYLY